MLVDTNGLILIHVQCPFHAAVVDDDDDDEKSMLMMKVIMEKSSFHRSYVADAKNVLTGMAMFLLMNDTNDNYVDAVHELSREYDELLDYNDLLASLLVCCIF